MATRTPAVIQRVCTIVLELHVTRTLQMNTTADLKRMAVFWESYVLQAGFRFWFLHANPGSSWDRSVPLELRQMGLDPSTCCYEVGLRREAPECEEPGR